MSDEYVKERINLINRKVDLKNYKQEIKELKFQRAFLIIAFVGVSIFTLFRG